MESQHFANPTGWSIVLLGSGLAALAALTPHFNSGYYLHAGVMIANLSPYLVYAVAVPLMPGAVTTSVGIIVLAAHGGLVLSERFIGGADYGDGMIYAMPLVLAVSVLPLAAYAMYTTSQHKPADAAEDEETASTEND